MAPIKVAVGEEDNMNAPHTKSTALDSTQSPCFYPLISVEPTMECIHSRVFIRVIANEADTDKSQVHS